MSFIRNLESFERSRKSKTKLRKMRNNDGLIGRDRNKPYENRHQLEEFEKMLNNRNYLGIDKEMQLLRAN